VGLEVSRRRYRPRFSSLDVRHWLESRREDDDVA
jgi:hypothetical protein